MYETRLFPEHEYTFKQALTYQLAHERLLHERRRKLHTRPRSCWTRPPLDAGPSAH